MKTCLITGASGGVARALADVLRLAGWRLALVTRDAGRITAAADELVIQADVASEDDVLRMVGTTIADLGGLDILINNAGIQTSADSHEMTSASFDQVLGTNLRGAFLCARETIKHLLAENKPGAIV